MPRAKKMSVVSSALSKELLPPNNQYFPAYKIAKNTDVSNSPSGMKKSANEPCFVGQLVSRFRSGVFPPNKFPVVCAMISCSFIGPNEIRLRTIKNTEVITMNE